MKLLVSGTVPPGAGLSVSGCVEAIDSAVLYQSAQVRPFANRVRAPPHSSSARSSLSSWQMGLPRGSAKAMSWPWRWQASTAWVCALVAWMWVETPCHISGRSDRSLTLTVTVADAPQQAASALCLSNTLLHLSFFPSLSPVPLPLPKSVGIVITNSLAPHDLTDTAPEQYNLRVVESLVAARLLLHAWGLSDHPRVKGKVGEGGRVWLREVLEMWAPGESPVGVYEKALKDLERILGKGGRAQKGWTTEEMIAESGMSKDEFTETYLHHFLEGESSGVNHFYGRFSDLEPSLTPRLSPRNPLPPLPPRQARSRRVSTRRPLLSAVQ